MLVVILAMAAVSHVAPFVGPHIADVNILLPPKMTHPVEYRLQGSDGCFKWSWDHHDILSVAPEYNSSNRCSTSARLRSVLPYSGRKETAVYATDIHTGMVIRCKVYIDNFSRIQIFHSSIKLDLDGLATLRVRAFDAEDNVFSSLVGLQFNWKLVPDANGLPPHLLHVPLRDSPLSDCGGLCGDLDIQIKLEETGVFSDLFVVQGVGIGHQIVSVHLHEPQLDHMLDTIVLTVAEAMSIDPPSPVLVLIGAVVHYTLKVIRGNIPQVVTLPSPYLQWSSSNLSVAELNMEMGLAHALRLGVSSITVEDTRVAGHVQMSSLHVVLPDTIHLYLLPLSQTGEANDEMNPIPSVSRWYVVSGRSYLVLIKVYSRGPGAQEIYITETDDVKLHGDQLGNCNILPAAENAAFNYGSLNSRILEAASYGLGKLLATLTYNTGDAGTKEVLKVVQEVMVCNQVKFSLNNQNVAAKSILLPWAPTMYQEMDLKATGGCGKVSTDYKWFSSDRATISVSAYGVVQAKRPGKATIKVVSIFDPLNSDEVVIEVSIPSSMVMLQNFPVETIVGSHLQAAVTMKASNGVYFDICDAFSSFIKWQAGSESFKIMNVTMESVSFDMQYGPPCAWTNVYTSGSGCTMLSATLSIEHYPFDHSPSGSIILKASSRIAAYPSLITHQAGDGNQFGGYWFNLALNEASHQLENLDELYLVPGSYLDIILLGGPGPWGEGVQFIEAVEVLTEEKTALKNGAVAYQLPTSNASSYRISCNKLGTFRIVFKRGNLIGDDHPLPAVAEAQLRLRCSFPSSIVLIVDEAANRHDIILRSSEAARSADRVCVTPVTVAYGRTIRVSSVGISNSGKAFGNSSSLQLRWELENCDRLASWAKTSDLATTKSSWERFLMLQNVSGMCIVRALVTGFSENIDVDRSILPFEDSETNLTDAVRLQLVSKLRVEPEFSLLFFSHHARLNLSITGGSCSLDTVVNNSEVVQVIQPPSSLHCLQLVLAPKGLGTTLVTIYDIGISLPLSATSVVQVSDLDWIRITSPQELSIMEGSLHSIDLLVGIDGGHTFHISQYAYMSIRVHIKDSIVELAESDDMSRATNGYLIAPNFVVRARHIGVTTLYVSARQHFGREILSQPIMVEVYAMPRLHPSDIFLVPGASYVLTLRGGPAIGAHVEFGSMDVDTATVHIYSGRLSAVSPGNTTVVAKVYGHGGAVICQASCQVTVGIPSSAILITQSDQLAVNHEMPIFPSFSEGNLFSFYELCKNYKWIIDKEVLSFQITEPLPNLKDTGSTFYGDENDLSFVEVIHGRSAGIAKVAVSFSCDFDSDSFHQSTTYSAFTTVSVVSELPLALGASMTWTLPPHHTSSNLLPMSSTPYSQDDILRRKGVVSYSLLTQCGRKNEEMLKHALSIEGDRIKTDESNNIACVQAKDRFSGRTEVAACIRVEEVSQIRINNKNLRRVDLVIGAEIDLPIKYYDVLGIPFLEAFNVPFVAEINYPDVVHINVRTDGNGSINLKAMHQGRALLRLSFNNNEQKSDYMLISVGAHLYPQNPVLQRGSRIKFSVEGSNDHVFGQWLTANESIISVDTMTGKSEAVGEGITRVVFESSSLKLQTTVTVQNSGIIVVDAPKDAKLVNAPYPGKGYSFPVNFRNAHHHELEAPQNGIQVPYECSVDPPYIGYTLPWKDLETGKLSCLFFPHPPEHLERSIPKSKDMKHETYVSVKASIKGAYQISGSASALFTGGFSILDMDKTSMQLNLSGDYFIHNLTIVGNTDLEVEWKNHNSLTVKIVEREDFGIGGRAIYEFKVASAPRRDYLYIGRAGTFTDKVIFTRLATGQREEINFRFTAHYPFRWHVEQFFLITLLFFSIILVIYCTIKHFLQILSTYRATHPQPPNVAIATPTIATPGMTTPVRGSPGGDEEQSRKTPPPFVEYLARTIEETPNYFRGEARRRRVNLQNSF